MASYCNTNGFVGANGLQITSFDDWHKLTEQNNLGFHHGSISNYFHSSILVHLFWRLYNSHSSVSSLFSLKLKWVSIEVLSSHFFLNLTSQFVLRFVYIHINFAFMMPFAY